MKNLNPLMLPKAKNAYDFPLLIKYIFDQSLNYQPNNEVVYKDAMRYNYYQFNERVRQLSNLFDSLNLFGGHVIGVVDYDSHRYLENYFAVPMTANVLHTVNWRLSPEQILYTINHAEDEVLIVHQDFLPLIESFYSELTTVKTIIVIQESETFEKPSFPIVGEYEELLAKQSKDYVFQDFDENAVATLFYTTGTTGKPKGVFFTHRQLVMHTLSILTTLGVTNEAFKFHMDEVYLPLTPMFHVHAWGMPYVATALGLKQIYIGKFDPQMLLKVYLTEKPTLSHCVPTILNMLLTNPVAKEVDFSGWQVLIGGAALSKPLAKLALDRGISIVTGYGMSETGPILSISYVGIEDLNKDLDEQLEMRTLTGRKAFMVDLQLMDESGNVVPKDNKTFGEIVARTPSLTMNYYKDNENGEKLWEYNYLHTGDIAVWNESGDFKIVDRSKDVIKTGGEWISTLALEELIGKHPDVVEVAVIGIPDVKWDERPLALVVLKNDAVVDENEMKSFLSTFVADNLINKWAIPEKIVFADSIPKTSVGKIDKKIIREQYN